jgi:ABC-type sugar transport system ATPase subunit
MLFQRPALVPNQTVRQNLRWAWSLREPWAFLQRGADPREIDLVRIARLLDLDRDLDRPVQQLSGGQQQRVALGRCLLRRASIWLLDEPLGHLDAPLKTDLRRQIRMLARNFGITMVHVTHDPDEAFAVGDRVAVMQEGQIVQVDEPRQLQRFPQNRFVAELVHHQQGGLNVWAGQFCRQGEEAFFQGAFGRWPIPKRIAAVLLEKFRQDKNFPPEGGNLNIILGIAASEVRCHADHDGNGDEIRQTLPVLQRECSAVGTWLIAGDARGRWVGRSAGFERGNEVMMAFSMERAYWFDGVTGQTLSARAG